jgi:hypothetical protein
MNLLKREKRDQEEQDPQQEVERRKSKNRDGPMS